MSGTRSAKNYVMVSGTAQIHWTVYLPKEHAKESVVCDDPAVEAVLASIGQNIDVYLWGQDKQFATVDLEIDESEVEVEEDEREAADA